MSEKNLNVRRRLLRMKLLGWRPDRIAKNLNLSESRVRSLLAESDLYSHESFTSPRRTGLHADASAARGILEKELAREPWTLGKWGLADVNGLLRAHGIEMGRQALYGLLARMGYSLRWVRDNEKTKAAS